MAPKKVIVTVTLGESKITIEGPEGFVRSEVERLATLQTTTKKEKSEMFDQVGGDHVKTERQIVDEKQPRGHHEIATVLAYFLKKQGKEEFTEEDIRRAYIRALVRPPKVVGQALRDAKNKFDYIEGGSKRGTYRLSHHGERTVLFDLPRSRSEKGETKG
jgi:hypothetical protein